MAEQFDFEGAIQRALSSVTESVRVPPPPAAAPVDPATQQPLTVLGEREKELLDVTLSVSVALLREYDSWLRQRLPQLGAPEGDQTPPPPPPPPPAGPG